MQWDGQPESSLDNQDIPLDARNSSTLGNGLSLENIPYPISPSTTFNGDHQLLLGINNTTTYRPHDLPTPGHSSNSSGSPHPPSSRLSGETLWDRPSVGGAQVGSKRKFSEDSSPSADARTKASQRQAPKKRPHNIIEKRYRANLNEKIAELRDSVPSLRVAKKPNSGKDDVEDEDEDGDEVTPSNKLNKASILTKATEYIRHLEMRNKKLDDENKSLKQRLLKLEKFMSSGSHNAVRRDEVFTSNTTVEGLDDAVSKETTSSSDTTKNPPQGLIALPDIWKNFRASSAQSTEHYGHVYDTPEEGSRRGGWPTKIMVGSLAGLMIMEGFSEPEQSSDSVKRGLFGIPLEFLDGWWFLRSPKDFISAFMIFCRTGGVFPMIKGFMALSILAFLVFTYLFNSKPSTPPKEEKAETATPQRPPSLASPIEVRRAAWLTSTQVLRIPHHSFFPEWLALTSEWFKYTVRLVLGWPMYSWLTGRSGDDELARVKAWDIAIDAQLAGGDVEISRSRLILTIFASGLLPRSPSRLMLKALHCHLVLQGVGQKGSAINKFFNRIGAYFADYEWKMAQEVHATLPIGHPDRLPGYSSALLARDCKDVMLDSVLQRAYNLLYNRPTSESTVPEDALMDVVVEDHAVRSPLDALSAWFSSHQLRKALIASQSHTQEHVNHEFDYLLHSAIAIAPECSAAHTRAVAIKAVFFDGIRAANIQSVLSALPSSRPSVPESELDLAPTSLPVFIDSSTPVSACADISIGLQCAMTMAMLESSTQEEEARVQQAVSLFANMPMNPIEMTLLSFIPVYYVLQRLARGIDPQEYPSEKVTQCSRPVRTLYHWSRIEGVDAAVLMDNVIDNVGKMYEATGKHGPGLSRRQSSVSNDTGYVSSGE